MAYAEPLKSVEPPADYPEPIIQDQAFARPWAYPASIIISLSLLALDASLPRGATAAIGYCLVPAITVSTRSSRFFVGMTILCTVFTWIGLETERPGGLLWMSIFERTMVTSILWAAHLLIWRRARGITALGERSRELEITSKELERSNAELGSFASIVAHDIRSPLNTIGFLTSRLRRRPAVKEDPEALEILHSVEGEVKRTSELLRILLSYARVGGAELRREQCDVEAVLDSVRHALAAELAESGGEITNDPLPKVQADHTLIANVLQNLIQNSLRYRSEDPPHVHVSAVRRGEEWLFTVRDNGVGIDASDMERVFTPFRQAKRQGAERGGLGLGLATCKRAVERHGGRIEVSSVPGEGTTVLFSIPVGGVEGGERA